MHTVTIGYLADGTPCDYTTFTLFYAAWGVDPDLPIVLTEDILVQVWYADASQATFFDEVYSHPNIDQGGNAGYIFKYSGMFGHHYDETCPALRGYFTSHSSGVYTQNLVKFENLGFNTNYDESVGFYTGRYREHHIGIDRCYVYGINHGLYNYYQGSQISNSYLRSDDYAIRSPYGNTNLFNCILYATDSSSLSLSYVSAATVINCTFVSPTRPFEAYSNRSFVFVNSIIYCSEYARIYNSTQETSQSSLWNNSCIYQLDYPGKAVGNLTKEEFFPFYDTMVLNCLFEDPKFVNASDNFDNLADFAVDKTTSPCWPDNRAIVDNQIYPDNDLKLPIIGAWTDYEAPDFPERANVLTTDTVQDEAGLWTPATASKYLDGEFYGVNGTSEEGTYNPSGTAPNAVVLSLSDNGDGENITATISNSTDGATNEIYYDVYGSESWASAGSRTGNGDVVINSGEGNFWFYCASTKDGKSSVSLIYAGTVGSTTDSLIEQAMEAVRDQINAQNYTDSTGDDVTATVETLPDFRNVNACKIIVHKNMDEFTAGESASRLEELRIFVTVCEHSKTSAQITNERKLVENIKMLFTGRRLSLFSSVYCSAATDAVDGVNALKEQFLFINPIELTLETRR